MMMVVMMMITMIMTTIMMKMTMMTTLTTMTMMMVTTSMLMMTMMTTMMMVIMTMLELSPFRDVEDKGRVKKLHRPELTSLPQILGGRDGCQVSGSVERDWSVMLLLLRETQADLSGAGGKAGTGDSSSINIMTMIMRMR